MLSCTASWAVPADATSRAAKLRRGVAGVYGHAGAYRRLGQVDRGDIAGLEEPKRQRKFAAERGQKLTPGRREGIGRATAADQDNA